ncbi:MAG TPA: pyridoxal phosphate-dependent aminotransferase [Candidatus Binatia bacterium]|nr:pyridoxal phosphate-dependent aminotransferase [Candidatus Binatia bacterium]
MSSQNLLTSRRSFLQMSAAAAAIPWITEPMLAAAAAAHRQYTPDGVFIDSNENPLGPCSAAREAMSAIIPQGGRYSDHLTEEVIQTFAASEGLRKENIRIFAGSTPALHFGVKTFTSPQRSYVTADPGYEAGMFAAQSVHARVVKVPLTNNYSHDIRAMLAAAPDAGLFYICTPNNPTGTLTSHSDVEFLVENKPKDSVVMVDEAYLHFTEARSTVDLVKAGKDVIVLRTFSKAYGMAGLRCGFAIARPDLLDKLMDAAGWNFMPVTAVVAASASLKDANVVPERRRINAEIRRQTFEWLDRNGYPYIPSESNCFLLNVKRPGKEVIDAMAKQNVFIGRIWPVMPTCVRITVGTHDEMQQFQAALQKITHGTAAFSLPPARPTPAFRRNQLAGL